MSKQKLHLPGNPDKEIDLIVEDTLWTYCGLKVVKLKYNETKTINNGDSECIVLPLEGSAEIIINNVAFLLEGRSSVFDKISDFIYIPQETEFTITCYSNFGGLYAIPMAKCIPSEAHLWKKLEPKYCPAKDIKIELRGAGQSSRQINNLMSPTVWEHANKLCVVEVLTPSGNWSSYPPHKHDEECDGAINEEIYYFKCSDEKNGYGFHRTYTKDGEIDESVIVKDGDIFLVPKGYHGPCIAPPGYDLYYLNVLAGPNEKRTMCFCWDPDHQWIVDDYWKTQPMDPRLPMTK